LIAEPRNLGPSVNTESDEIFPFVHADGTLYFASNGHIGFGGLDLFFSYSFYVNGSLDELFDENNRPKVVRDFTLMISDNISSEMIEGATITYTNLDNLSITKAITGGGDPSLQIPDDLETDLLLRVPMEEMGMNGSTDFLGLQ